MHFFFQKLLLLKLRSSTQGWQDFGASILLDLAGLNSDSQMGGLQLEKSERKYSWVQSLRSLDLVDGSDSNTEHGGIIFTPSATVRKLSIKRIYWGYGHIDECGWEGTKDCCYATFKVLLRLRIMTKIEKIFVLDKRVCLCLLAFFRVQSKYNNKGPLYLWKPPGNNYVLLQDKENKKRKSHIQTQ